MPASPGMTGGALPHGQAGEGRPVHDLAADRNVEYGLAGYRQRSSRAAASRMSASGPQ